MIPGKLTAFGEVIPTKPKEGLTETVKDFKARYVQTEVSHDNHCLYKSIAHILKNKKGFQQIRKVVQNMMKVDSRWMDYNISIVNSEDPETLGSIRQRRLDETIRSRAAGYQEILMIGKLTGCEIVIHDLRDIPQFGVIKIKNINQTPISVPIKHLPLEVRRFMNQARTNLGMQREIHISLSWAIDDNGNKCK